MASKDKSLQNTDINKAKDNVSDIAIFGNGDSFKLLCKASSQSEGWMKSTKAYEIPDVGCIVQVTTQQMNKDGNYAIAEAVTFVPGVKLLEDKVDDEVFGRQLVDIRFRG